MIFSDNFKKSIKLIGIGVFLAFVTYLWLLLLISAKMSKPKTTLPINDVEQIKVDPSTHKLSIVTDNGIKTITLPDRVSTIDLSKDGILIVTSPQFGFEHHLFVGATISDAGRFSAGMDGWYFKRLDIGGGIASQFGEHTPIVFVKGTYNIYGNIQLGVIYGTNKYIGGILAVRLF